MTKDFKNFLEFLNEEKLANIINSLPASTPTNLEFEKTPEGFAKFQNDIFNLGVQSSAAITIKLLNAYHEWLNED